jgi:DNA-binding response OmpR family regulator
MKPSPLARRRILVVEDEYFIAEEIKLLLMDLGATVIGALPDQEKATATLSDTEIDCAVLDIDICGRAIFPLTFELKRRDIPWLYVSGYSERLVPEAVRGGAHLEKPVAPGALVASIYGLLR